MSIIEKEFVNKVGQLVKTFSHPSLARQLALSLQKSVNDNQRWGWPGAAVWGVGTVLVVKRMRVTWVEGSDSFEFSVIVQKEPRSFSWQQFGTLLPMELIDPKATNIHEETIDIALMRLVTLIRKTWMEDGFVDQQAINPEWLEEKSKA